MFVMQGRLLLRRNGLDYYQGKVHGIGIANYAFLNELRVCDPSRSTFLIEL